MNPKLIGVITGVLLALALHVNDWRPWSNGWWPPWKVNVVEELYKGAEAAFEDAGKSGDYKKYEIARENYSKALEKSDTKHKLYGEFNVLVNYKIALCYSDMAERGGSGDAANYDKALDIIKEISPKATETKHKEGLTYLWGHVLYKQGKYAEAEPKLRVFIENFPNSQFVEDALYALGNIKYNLKKYSKAREDLQSLLDKFPKSSYATDAQCLIVQSYLNENNFPKANEWFEKLNVEESSKKATDETKYRYAHNLLCLGNNSESLRQYNDFVANYPKSKFLAAAYFDMGNIYLKEKQYEKARQHFDMALQNTAGNDGMYMGMALKAKLGIAASSFELGDWQGIVDTLKNIKEQIQTETPEFIGYYNNLLTEAYYQLGEYEKAQSHGTSDSLETEAWRLSKEADTLFDKEYTQAAAKYNEVWTKAPMIPDLYKLKFRAKYREGLCYFKTGQFNEAVGAYNIALGFAEGAAKGSIEQQYIDRCRLNLALTYEKLKNWTDARKSYNEILKNSQSNYYDNAQLLLAQSYTQENPQEAIKEYEKASGDAARINRANLLYKTEKYAEAAALYEEIAKEVPQSKHANEAQYMAGLCYYEIKDKKPEDLNKAIGIFDKVVENPDSPYVLDAYYGKVLANKDLAVKYQSLWSEEKNEVRKKELAEKGISQYAETERVALAVLSKFTDNADARKTSIDTIRKYATGMKYKMEGIPKLDKDQQDIIESNPDPTAKAKAQLKRAAFYFKDPQFGDPLTAYQDLVNMAPGDEYIKIAKYQIVTHYYRNHNDEECVKAADDAIKYNPDEDMLVRIYYMRGKSKLSLGNREGATADFGIVAQMDSNTDPSRKPLIIDANERLAELSPGTGDYTAAIKSYEYTIQHTGDIASQDILTKVNAYYQIGVLYERQKDIDNAIQAFDNLRNYYETQKEKFRPGIMDKPEIENVIDKVMDSGFRRASLISDRDLDKAITDAEKVRNETVFSEDTAPYTTPLRRIHAHYQVGYLYYQRMAKAIKDKGSQDNINLYGRRAIPAFQEALRIQKPPSEAIHYVRDSAFLIGETSAALPGMAESAKNFLNGFITCANNGEFGSVGTDEKMRELLPKAMFSLAKVEHRLENYDRTIKILNDDLISKFSDNIDKPLWQFHIGEAYFARENFSQAKSEYKKALDWVPKPNPEDEASYGIGDDALYGMIVCVDQMKRRASPENQQALDEQKKNLNEQMKNDYPKSDYAPLAYINLATLDYNNGVDASDVNMKIDYFKKALVNYQIAYEHPKINNEKIKPPTGENKETAKIGIKDSFKELIQTNIKESSRLRNVPDESGALSYNENAISFCDQLIDKFPGDATIVKNVNDYIRQIESEIAAIEPLLPNDPRIPRLRRDIEKVKGKINP